MTATCPEGFLREILDALSITRIRIVRAVTTRPEISYNVEVYKGKGQAKSALLGHVQTAMPHYENGDKALVYSRARDTADDLASMLGCPSFHRGRPMEELKRTWADFLTRPDKNVLVATSLLGVGIDVPRVRNIWHFGMPWSLISYVQESGRGGRGGLKAFSHLLTWEKEIDSPPPTLEYTEGDLRKWVPRKDECRRTLIGQVLDGNTTSCVQLTSPNLCDNCRRESKEQHPGLAKTVPSARPQLSHPGPPLPSVPRRESHIEDPPEPSTRVKTPPNHPGSSSGTGPHHAPVQPQKAPSPHRDGSGDTRYFCRSVSSGTALTPFRVGRTISPSSKRKSTNEEPT